MKKISILTSTTLIIFLSLFTFSSMVFAQAPGKKSSITVLKNADNSIKRIEVRFTNRLTYDSLIKIKTVLKTYDINVNYKLIEFDEKNYLKVISCEAHTKKDGGGMFMMSVSDTTRIGGFFYDYSKDAKKKFCIGACELLQE